MDTLIFLSTYGKWLIVIVYFFHIVFKYTNTNRVRMSFPLLHVSFVCALLLWVLVVAITQYQFWMLDPLLTTFATSPLSSEVSLPGFSVIFTPFRNLPHAYFAHAMFVKFLAPILWQLGMLLFVAIMFSSARRWRPNLFGEDQLHLLLAALLLSGWPGVLVGFVLFLLIFLVHTTTNTMLRRGRTSIAVAAAIVFMAAVPISMKAGSILWILKN